MCSYVRLCVRESNILHGIFVGGFSFLIIYQYFLFQGLDKSPSKPVDNVTLKAPNATDIAGQRMDSYRFSMANLEGKTVITEILIQTLNRR